MEVEREINSNISEVCNSNLEKNFSNLQLVVCDPVEKCKDWLENKSTEDVESICSETTSGSVFTEQTDNSAMDSGYVFTEDNILLEDRICTYKKNGLVPIIESFNKKTTPSKYENINIYKSKKVHIGDVTIIQGPVIVNTAEKNSNTVKKEYDGDTFALNLINRINWLAQPSLGKREILTEPAKFIIIGHTATEEGFTQAENTLLVRLIQTFHIESRKWADIGYNFLIGSDGLIYEGRGWKLQGAHTKNYNSFSLGISFIGCFLEHLPPKVSLKRVKELIAYGVEKGHIARDYLLLGHCQCSAVESPGKRLYEEIQTWDHWDDSVTIKNPAECVKDRIADLNSENIP